MRTCAAKVQLPSECRISHSSQSTYFDAVALGGNPLVQHIGLGDATSVARLIVTWPTSQTTQTFTGLAADQSIVITEGSDQYQVLPQKPSTTPAGK